MDFSSKNFYMEFDRQRLDRSNESARKRTGRIVSGTEPGWNRVQRHPSDPAYSRADNENEGKMKKVTYLFINGILVPPGNVNNWNVKACAWIDQKNDWTDEKTQFKAERYEYLSDIFFRRISQEKRVDDIQVVINRMSQGDIILVGHSNGCDLIERLVRRNSGSFKEIHLIAAASERSFKINGYNEALRRKQVGEIYMYASPNDSALKQAKWSTRLFGWMGLGYGYLGLVGPCYISKDFKYKTHIINTKYDHCDYFNEKTFDETMKFITHSK